MRRRISKRRSALFSSGISTGAAKLLDLAEAATPNEPAFANLRGEILMEEKKFDEAEAVLRKAIAADPKFREAQYNLAQIPFKKGDYAKAREQLRGPSSPRLQATIRIRPPN